MAAMRFQEIEHKFLVGEGFDLEAFRATVRGLGPTRTTALPVRDVYYLSDRHPGYVFRHRYDRELQHLSVKSLERDPQVRLEVNLDLGQHLGDQQPAVEAFLGALEVAWRGEVHKEIEVFTFPDCEIVYYSASSGSRVVRCVELEALEKTSVDAALEVLRRYERLTGFEHRERTRKAVVELLYPSIAGIRPAGDP